MLPNNNGYTGNAKRYAGVTLDPDVWYLMATNAERGNLPDPSPYVAYHYDEDSQYLMMEGDALNQQDLEESFGVLLEALAAEFAEQNVYHRAFRLEKVRSKVVHADVYNG